MLCSITEKFCTIPNQQTNRRILKACKGIWKKNTQNGQRRVLVSAINLNTQREKPHICVQCLKC